MLIIMENWNIQQLIEILLDVKTVRGMNILQTNGIEHVSQFLHDPDNLIRIFLLQHNGHHIDARQLIEKCAFALHDR